MLQWIESERTRAEVVWLIGQLAGIRTCWPAHSSRYFLIWPLTSSTRALVGSVRSFSAVPCAFGSVTAMPRESAAKFGVSNPAVTTAGAITGTEVLPFFRGAGRPLTSTALVMLAEMSTVGRMEGTKSQWSKNSQSRPSDCRL